MNFGNRRGRMECYISTRPRMMWSAEFFDELGVTALWVCAGRVVAGATLLVRFQRYRALFALRTDLQFFSHLVTSSCDSPDIYNLITFVVYIWAITRLTDTINVPRRNYSLRSVYYYTKILLFCQSLAYPGVDRAGAHDEDEVAGVAVTTDVVPEGIVHVCRVDFVASDL